MSRHLVDDPHKTDAQHATKTHLMTNELRDMSFGHKRDANEAKDPAGEVFDIHELLVMILSPLFIRELGRALSVSKQWNKTILNSMELRRTLFLEPERAREHVYWIRDPRWWRTVMVCEPNQGLCRLIIEPHPILMQSITLWNSAPVPYNVVEEVRITLPCFDLLKNVHASAFLFQPPIESIKIKHWYGAPALRIQGGVTFGAVLEVIERIRTAAEEAMKRSPRFAGHLYGNLDQTTVTICAKGVVIKDNIKVAEEKLEKALSLDKIGDTSA